MCMSRGPGPVVSMSPCSGVRDQVGTREGIQGGYTGWVIGGSLVLPLHRARKPLTSEAGPGSSCRELEWVG